MCADLLFQAEDRAWHRSRLTYRRASLCWNETGTGETRIAIGVADDLEAKTRIVFCPAIARINWYREIIANQDDPLFPIYVIGVDGDIPPDDFNRGWVICNYERVRNGQTKLLFWLKRPWSLAILDEHQYLSNSESQRTGHFYNGSPQQGGRLAPWFEKCMLMSGTPFRNSYADIWAHLFIWFADTITEDGKRMDEETFKDTFTNRVNKVLPSG